MSERDKALVRAIHETRGDGYVVPVRIRDENDGARAASRALFCIIAGLLTFVAVVVWWSPS